MSETNEELEKEILSLRREKRGLEEMLYLVLDEVAEPVEVPAEKMKNGGTGDRMIDITHQADIDCWVFRVVDIPNE